MKTFPQEEGMRDERFPADPIFEGFDPRCPVCCEILYLEQGVNGAVFQCSCTRDKRRRQSDGCE